jgi:hypothetical protein
MFIFFNLFLTIPHRFSIGFMSGLFSGYGKVFTSFSAKNLVMDLALWHGAPSCMKTKSPSGNQSFN